MSSPNPLQVTGKSTTANLLTTIDNLPDRSPNPSTPQTTPGGKKKLGSASPSEYFLWQTPYNVERDENNEILASDL